MNKLTPPNLTPDDIDHLITCVRPKRNGGARIEQERLPNGKRVVHNYGHGGFGWSLLPGSVKHALSLFDQAIEHDPTLAASKKVTVLGAGCYGLLTALFLHKRGWEVCIIAEQTEQLASHKAAGSLAVIAIKASRANQPLMDQVAVDSFLFYKEIASQETPEFAGITPLPVYMIHVGTPDYRYPLIVAGAMEAPEEVVVDFGNAVTYKAKKFNTYSLDTDLIMQEFIAKLQAYNIPIIKKKITTFDTIDTSIIFNCSGLGARAWDATPIVPVQGHLVRLKNQPSEALDYIVYAHIKIDGRLQEISWTPKGGGTLGGSAINWEERLDTNPEQADIIIRRARIFFGGKGD